MNEQSQVISFGMIALFGPMIAVGGFQLVMSEPASVKADVINTEFRPLPSVPALAEVVDSVDFNRLDAVSPFWFEEVELSLPVMPLVARPVDVDEWFDPDFMLSAMLPSANNSLAVINGKACVMGDEVEPGWTLIKIAAKDRYVILKHTSGRRLRVLMSQGVFGR